MKCGLLIPDFKKELRQLKQLQQLWTKRYLQRVCLQDSPAAKRPDSTVQGVGMHVHGHSVCKMLCTKRKNKTLETLIYRNKEWNLIFMSRIKAKTERERGRERVRGRAALVSYLQGDVIAIVRPEVGSLFPGDVCQGARVCQEPCDCLQGGQQHRHSRAQTGTAQCHQALNMPVAPCINRAFL